MSISAAAMVEKVIARKEQVLEALAWPIPDLAERKALVEQIIETEHYIRYLPLVHTYNELRGQMILIAVYHAIDESHTGMRELDHYLYS